MTSRSPGKRWISVVLFASLALNLFFGGLFLARHAFAPRRTPETMLSHMIEILASRVPAADAQIVRRVFKSHETDITEHFADVMRARQSVHEAMAREPFDRDGLSAALDTVRSKDLSLRQSLQQALVETASELSPEARRKLAALRPMRP